MAHFKKKKKKSKSMTTTTTIRSRLNFKLTGGGNDEGGFIVKVLQGQRMKNKHFCVDNQKRQKHA